jgi:O-antigen polysaccharide polymerase Wzy
VRSLDARLVRPLLAAYSVGMGILAVGTALWASANGADPMAHFPWIVVASVAILGSLVAMAGVWTATGVYVTVFWSFHFGLIAVLATGSVSVAELSYWDLSWVLGPFAAEAAMLALAGMLAFASGASLIYVCRRPTFRCRRPGETRAPAHPYGTAGSMLFLVALSAWCAIVVSTAGLAGFVASYGDFLEATSAFGSTFGIVWLVLGCGLILSITGKAGWLRTSVTVTFGVLAVVTLPIGLRGEIMFRTMAALVAAARCGRRLPAGKAVAVGLAMVTLIPVVREVRQTGLRGLSNAIVAPHLQEAFAEMGASLQPVEKVVRWHTEGEPLEHGGSYWAPFERAATRLLPGLESGAADNDLRIMNVLVTDRVGAIGFSPVAEAYRNFGALGVVVVLGLLGAVMATLDTLRDRRVAVLALAIVYVPLLTNVRNSFVSVPAQCATGLAIVLALGIVRHVTGSVLSRPYARPAYIRSEI